VVRALQRALASPKAVVVADVQDNPGAGGHSCTTGVLHALLRAQAGKRFPGQVILGLIDDVDAAQAAHVAGIGGVMQIGVGRSVKAFDGTPTESAAQAAWKVLALSNGKAQLTGPMMTRADVNLGPCAALESEGVVVAVASARKQMLDLGLFQMVGIEPTAAKIIVVKSSNHYRAAFSPLVDDPERDIINVKSAAAFAADPADLPYTKLPPHLRKAP
jgi:microcystin degradation protein MlrC